MKEKNNQPKIPSPAKLNFKNEGEIHSQTSKNEGIWGNFAHRQHACFARNVTRNSSEKKENYIGQCYGLNCLPPSNLYIGAQIPTQNITEFEDKVTKKKKS